MGGAAMGGGGGGGGGRFAGAPARAVTSTLPPQRGPPVVREPPPRQRPPRDNAPPAGRYGPAGGGPPPQARRSRFEDNAAPASGQGPRARSPPPPRRRPEAPLHLRERQPPPRERTPPPRPSPARPGPRYHVKLPRDAVHMRERNLQNIAMRYPNLYVPSECTRAFALWPELLAGPERVRFDAPVKFVIADPEPEPAKAEDNSEPAVEAKPEVALSAEASEAEKPVADANAEPCEVPDTAGVPKNEVASGDGDAEMVAAGAAAEGGTKPNVESTTPPPNEVAIDLTDAMDASSGEANGVGEKVAATPELKADAGAADWAKLTVGKLRSVLGKRGLLTRGNKAELVARLREADEAAAGEGNAMQVDGAAAVTAAEAPTAILPPVNAANAPAAAEAPAATLPAVNAADAPAAAEAPAATLPPVKAERTAPKEDTPERPVVGPDGSQGTWWHAKVLVVGGLPAAKLRAEAARDYVHPQHTPFLLRKRPKGELMLFGGPWAPCDGAHPAADPAALVRTAVRTVQEQAGVDLSACAAWPKLLELQYRRGGSLRAGDAGYMQRTVVFVVSAADVAEPNAAGVAEVQAAEVRRSQERTMLCSRMRSSGDSAIPPHAVTPGRCRRRRKRKRTPKRR